MSLKILMLVLLSVFLITTANSATMSDYGYCTTDKYIFTDERGQIIGIWDFNQRVCYSQHFSPINNLFINSCQVQS